MTIHSMLVEIIACLALAALLGLLVGWMIRRAIANREANKAALAAAKRYKSLEASSRAEADKLEDQIQALGGELKSVQNNNQSLNDSLRETESTIHKARSESIELNQNQLETNERLQSIIREKDAEISRLMKSSPTDNGNLAAAAAGIGASAAVVSRVVNRDSSNDSGDTLDATAVMNGPLHHVSAEKTQQAVDALDAGTEKLREERQNLLDALTDGEQTIAIDQTDLPAELRQAVDMSDIDATVAIEDMDETIAMRSTNVDQDDTEMSDTVETPK